jgi:hypothetical protein
MWMHYALVELTFANDRAREAEEEARRWRLEQEIRESSRQSSPRRPGRVRALLAAPVRGLSNATHGFSEVACTVATRIEGGAA